MRRAGMTLGSAETVSPSRGERGAGAPRGVQVWPALVNVACYAVFLAGMMTLLGWAQREPLLVSLFMGYPPTKWNAAVSLVALGVAILLRRTARPGKFSEVLADGLAGLAFLLAAGTLLEHGTGGWPHIDNWARVDAAALGRSARMSIGASADLVLVSLGVLTLDRMRRLSATMLTLAGMLALSAMCGFLYGVKTATGANLPTAMGIQTSVSVLLLCWACFAARPTREPMRSLFAPELGVEARIELLLGTWVLPLLIGVAVKEGLERGWYDSAFALGLFAVLLISLQTGLIWRSDYALTQLTQNKAKMEDVLRKNEKLAVAGRLAASISHEINNPLESISNLLYLIRTSDRVEDQHSYADLAMDELRRVTQITTQTLSFYRESATPKLSEVVPIVQSSVQLLRGKISSMRIDLVERYRNPVPAIVCSAGELRQVLVNLISNALDATPRGGKIVVRASLSKAWTRGDRRVVRIVVADSGSGMPAAVLARVFEPFYTTKEKTGNGLGLWVAADLVEKHGGWMKVRSRTSGKWRGTTFELVLPVGSGDVGQAAAA
jgi:signal transduction histidine kinase